jgi:hypothetical protein
MAEYTIQKVPGGSTTPPSLTPQTLEVVNHALKIGAELRTVRAEISTETEAIDNARSTRDQDGFEVSERRLQQATDKAHDLETSLSRTLSYLAQHLPKEVSSLVSMGARKADPKGSTPGPEQLEALTRLQQELGLGREWPTLSKGEPGNHEGKMDLPSLRPGMVEV